MKSMIGLKLVTLSLHSIQEVKNPFQLAEKDMPYQVLHFIEKGKSTAENK